MNTLLNWINSHQNMLAGVVILICLIITWVLNRNEKKSRKVFVILWVLYLGAVFYKAVFSRDIRNSVVNIDFGWSYRAWMAGEAGMFSQIILNIMFYIPLGCFAKSAFPNKKRFWLLAFFNGVVTSVIVESLQLFLSVGMFELDDIFNNSMGTLIGVGAAIIIAKYSKCKNKESSIFTGNHDSDT